MTRPWRIIRAPRRAVASIVVFVLACAPAASFAQSATEAKGLVTLIGQVFGPHGLTVDSNSALLDGSTHAAHFNSDFQTNFRRFNIALASQLSALPLPSPASGFTYRFDSDTGTFVRSTQSFGPILADRAETIGRGKIVLGYNFQAFSFDSLDGVDLRHVPAVFTHDDAQLGGGRTDVVVTDNAIKLSVHQYTGIVTFGVTDRLDLSFAIPLINTRLALSSTAVIHRFGTTREDAVHFFSDPLAPNGIGDLRVFSASGTAFGMGDVLVRTKHNIVRRGRNRFAVGAEVRIPSGNEYDLLGSGAWGAKPFLVASFVSGRVSPHVNVAYQLNGASVLAGDAARGIADDLPDRLLLTAGFDAGINQRLSVAVDFLAERVLDSPRLEIAQFAASGDLGAAVFQNIMFSTRSYLISNGAAGMKFALREGLLANFNVRFSAGGDGLTDRVTPLVGIEYGF
ncbi:MAG TPA: hypothetical protein VKB50_11765 [Vicinamibacterales bacterium]|nr:hypothetical protein [Vicinamibacterales bacterium]